MDLTLLMWTRVRLLYMKAPCPICKSNSDFIAYGVVAPWISILLNGTERRLISTSLHKCASCSINFFSYRYTKKELESIYKDYRTDDWYKLRHSWEPWYREGTNNAYSGGKSEKNLDERKKWTESLLKSSGLNTENLGDYLDFGGDAGQFFPDGVQGRRILFDLQQQQVDGIETISDPKELTSLVSVVSSCYVLEHTPDILEGIQEMRDVLN